MSFENQEKASGTRHKAREAALQMLFGCDMASTDAAAMTRDYWNELGDEAMDERNRDFANKLATGTIENLSAIDDTIRTRAEHWRIERMAIVDRNVLRLAVFELQFFDTPNTVAINEALELARKFSTYESTQFVNGVLDAIKQDLSAASTDDESRSTSTTAAK